MRARDTGMRRGGRVVMCKGKGELHRERRCGHAVMCRKKTEEMEEM